VRQRFQRTTNNSLSRLQIVIYNRSKIQLNRIIRVRNFWAADFSLNLLTLLTQNLIVLLCPLSETVKSNKWKSSNKTSSSTLSSGRLKLRPLTWSIFLLKLLIWTLFNKILICRTMVFQDLKIRLKTCKKWKSFLNAIIFFSYGPANLRKLWDNPDKKE